MSKITNKEYSEYAFNSFGEAQALKIEIDTEIKKLTDIVFDLSIENERLKGNDPIHE